jgi:phosphatidylglycerophosphate synthase
LLHVVGRSERRIFGLDPAERLRRQLGAEEVMLVADASAVLDDAAVRWLIENPGQVLSSDAGKALAVVVEEASEAETALASGRYPSQTAGCIGERYIRKLRRKSALLALSLDEVPPREVERQLFGKVYKGVTDLVTKYVWPAPALVVTRAAAAAGISPNVITAIGFVLMLVASWYFFTGAIALGLTAGWAMTFLDTVDGKLARVTVTSSRLGNWLDHGTDIIHPPLWWICLAHGLAANDPGSSATIILSCAIILGCYVIGRLVEISFHLLFGFNAFLFRPFDSAFRTIVARRNILLLIMMVGLVAGRATEAFVACATWSVISTLIQLVRIGQAWLQSRAAPLTPWMA